VFKTVGQLFLTRASFINIRFNIIPINPSFSNWSLSCKIQDQDLVFIHILSNTCHIPSPSCGPSFSHPNDIWWGLKVMKLPIMQLSPVSCHFSLSGTHILRSTLYSNILCYCSSLRLAPSFPPLQISCQITLQFIVIIIFWGTKTEDKLFWTEW
jgi:hypothetical protein